MTQAPCVISIEGIEVFAHHGVLADEKEHGQQFLIDVRLELFSVPITDDLGATVDYAGVAEQVERLATTTRHDLIETLARQIGESLLIDGRVRKVVVTVRKPQAPMPVSVGSVGVTVTTERVGTRGYLTGEDDAS